MSEQVPLTAPTLHWRRREEGREGGFLKMGQTVESAGKRAFILFLKMFPVHNGGSGGVNKRGGPGWRGKSMKDEGGKFGWVL